MEECVQVGSEDDDEAEDGDKEVENEGEIEEENGVHGKVLHFSLIWI